MTIAMASAQLGVHWIRCADCNGWFDPYNDPSYTVSDYFDEKIICPNCLKYAGLYACDDCGRISDGDDLNDCGGNWYCDGCASDAGWAACDGCGVWMSRDDQYTSPDNNTFCDSCYDDRHSPCDSCG